MALGDRELVERAQAGDLEAFATLYQRNRSYLYRVARCFVRHESAEDVCQEAFFAAWQSIGKLEDRGSFRAWLSSFARTTAIDHFRREQKHQSRRCWLPGKDGELREIDEVCASREPDALRKAAGTQMIELLRQVPLSERDRRVFHMMYVENLGAREIAFREQTTERMIETKLYRIRKKLRAAGITGSELE